MSALLASQQLQADTAGLTSTPDEPTAHGPNLVELAASYVHGESGSLGYLFGEPFPVPVSDAIRALPLRGPNGGFAHPSSVFHRQLGAGAGYASGAPTGVPLAAPVPPTQAPAVPAPGVPSVADRARSVLGQAQEKIRGLFDV